VRNDEKHKRYTSCVLYCRSYESTNISARTTYVYLLSHKQKFT